MTCKATNYRQYQWDDIGATFECEPCQMTHRMCCAVYQDMLCGKVDNHEGNHASIYLGKEWDNSVYKLRKMGP